MKLSFLATAITFLLAISVLPQAGWSETPEKALTLSNVAPTNPQVTIEESSRPSEPGLLIHIEPGNSSYPGIAIKPESEVWNLAEYGHLEAKIVNAGSELARISLRADNKGNGEEKTWNVEAIALKPGESKVLKLIFGYSSKFQPAYKLDSSAINQLLLFSGKVAKQTTLRLESIKAAGSPGETPPIDLSRARTRPQNGFLLGGDVKVDPASQVVCKDGAIVSELANKLQVSFSKPGQSVLLKAPEGLWDLRDGHEVRVKIRNAGSTTVRPGVRIESKPGNTAQATCDQPLAPGGTAEIVASFVSTVPARIEQAEKPKPLPGTGTKFTSDAVTGVVLVADENASPQTFEIESIQLKAVPIELPEWVGKRPPVEGEWVQTFNEDFSGNEVNLQKWNIYTSNFWDKRTHFSVKNVVIADGIARLRCEKRTGRHNDDPNGKETAYATGFLDTYGKWVQRYGYFEARMKLPKADGLWPAFWLMPDRGLEAGVQWKRASTSDNGMEFDIMEFLSRWGSYRFSPAFHWDGYGKEHKATGGLVYTRLDQEGYITTGLLWLPGELVIYNNGQEVLRWESPRISSVPSDIMFTNVTGGWDNSPLNDAQLPDELAIDYVRCWQRKDLASNLDGVKSIQATPAAPTVADAVVKPSE